LDTTYQLDVDQLVHKSTGKRNCGVDHEVQNRCGVSRESVNRAVVEGDVVHNMWLADQMASLSQIFLCIDESSKVMGRSFVEIEIGGQYLDNRKTAWFSPLVVREVVSHLASKMAQIIADKLQHINAIQESRNLHQTRIYKIVVITFDLTSANTSRLGGLGRKLDEKHTKMWENNKAANKIPSWLRDQNQQVASCRRHPP